MHTIDEDKPDGATPERLAKAGEATGEFVTSSGRRTKRLLDGSVLDLLLSRRVITGDQYHAGARFYSDWYYAGLAQSGVVDPARIVVDGSAHPGQTDRALDALTRWKAALVALGMVHSHVMTSVVLLEVPLVEYGWQRFRQRAPEKARLTATVALKGALDQLDSHYYGKREGTYRCAHAADYRPAIIDRD